MSPDAAAGDCVIRVTLQPWSLRRGLRFPVPHFEAVGLPLPGPGGHRLLLLLLLFLLLLLLLISCFSSSTSFFSSSSATSSSSSSSSSSFSSFYSDLTVTGPLDDGSRVSSISRLANNRWKEQKTGDDWLIEFNGYRRCLLLPIERQWTELRARLRWER